MQQLQQSCAAHPVRQSLLVGLRHAVECLAKLVLLVSGRVQVTRPALHTWLRLCLDVEAASAVGLHCSLFGASLVHAIKQQ